MIGFNEETMFFTLKNGSILGGKNLDFRREKPRS